MGEVHAQEVSLRESKLYVLAIMALGLLSAVARAEDWPKWRGPNGDGIVRESGLMTEWPASGPVKLWSAPVGTGHASPVVVEGKLYLFTRD